MVAHLLWEQGVAGSNPVAPTRIMPNGLENVSNPFFWIGQSARRREASRLFAGTSAWNIPHGKEAPAVRKKRSRLKQIKSVQETHGAAHVQAGMDGKRIARIAGKQTDRGRKQALNLFIIHISDTRR